MVAKLMLNQLYEEGSRQSLLSLAADELASPDLLELIARRSDLEIARLLAQNESTPPTVLEKLAYLDDKEVLVSVAKNTQTSSETLTKVFKRITGDEGDSRHAYYGHRPLHGSKEGSSVGYRALKVALALNRNTPVDILSELCDDYDYVVSAAVFGNCKLPNRFFTDYMSETIEIAGPSGLLNPLMPYRDLSRQFGGSSGRSWQVAKNARMYGFGSEKYESQNRYTYRYIEVVQGAGFPRLPQESLDAITSIGVGFPKTIVLNPAATLDVLVQALGEPLATRAWIAKDPHTPQVVLEKLYHNSGGLVRIAASTNPNLPESVFEERFGGFRDKEQRVEEDEERIRDYDCGPSPEELDYSGWERHSDWVEYGKGADVEYWNDAAMDELQPIIDADKAATAEIEVANAAAEDERLEEESYQSFLEEYAFALNPSAPDYVLRLLASRGGDIARAVASNPNASQSLLRQLFNRECWDAVIMNPSCSISLLESLDDGVIEKINMDSKNQGSQKPSVAYTCQSDEEIPF